MDTKNVKITKSYKTPKGNIVTVTGVLELEKVVWLDGYEGTVSCCELHVTVEATGHGIISYSGTVNPMTPAQKKQAPAEYNWTCGKLALTDEQAEIIRSVRHELEQHPAWQKKQAALDKYLSESDERQNSSGWCKRCQDWTYGDCGHH